MQALVQITNQIYKIGNAYQLPLQIAYNVIWGLLIAKNVIVLHHKLI